VEEIEQVAVHMLLRLKLAIELIGAVLIAWGCLVTTIDLIQTARSRQVSTFTGLRLRLGRFLAMGLEFQLAADILATAVSPSWEELGKLAAIAAIRTALNFFLNLELKEQEAARDREGTAAPAVGPANG
jgi:uncharacterized membrane protein